MNGYGSHDFVPLSMLKPRVDDQHDKKRKNKRPRTTESRHVIGDPFAEGGIFFDDFVWIAHGAQPHQLLRSMKLFAQHGQHIHSGHGLALQQHRNVVAVHFDAGGFLHRRGVRLVRRLLQHGRETEKFTVAGLVHHHFLMIFVHGGHAHLAGKHHIGVAVGVAYLVDALQRHKFFHLHL